MSSHRLFTPGGGFTTALTLLLTGGPAAGIELSLSLNKTQYYPGEPMIITLTAYNIIGPFGMYISIYHVCDGDKDFASRLFGLGSTIGAVSAIAALWPITRISALLGKKACLIVGEVIVLLAFGLLRLYSLIARRRNER